ALEQFEFRTMGGRVLARFPIGSRGRALDAPPLGILRADLHHALAQALGREHIRFGAPCVGFREDPAGVRALMADGSEVRGDVLVGADGMASAVRAQLHGPEAPRYPGYGHWSGFLADGARLAPAGTFRILFGPGRRFGFLPVGGGTLCWWC